MPSDLLVVQSTKLELVVNAEIARSSRLAVADEVIK
jgi:hypothetical protein